MAEQRSSREARRLLTQALKIRFSIPPRGLTNSQLDRVIDEVDQKSRPKLSDWAQAIRGHVRAFGTFKYERTDTSDLNELLDQIKRR